MYQALLSSIRVYVRWHGDLETRTCLASGYVATPPPAPLCFHVHTSIYKGNRFIHHPIDSCLLILHGTLHLLSL